MRKENLLISICLILVITYIAFYPSLENDFVNWDDPLLLIDNRHIKELSLQSIKNIFTSLNLPSLYHPLIDLSYAIEYWLFELTPLAYHTTNLVLHMLNCLLVFWLIFLFSDKIGVALLAALFFGIHPLHVESVAWVTERKDVLYAFFFLGALISYIYYMKKGNRKDYYISLSLFILSLLSKAMALTLPFVLILCDYILNIKFKKKILKEKAIFFIISFLFAMFTLYGLWTSKNLSQAPPMPFYNYIFSANYGLLFYLSKLIMPIRLSCFYPYPEDISGFSVLIFLILPAITIALILLVIISKRYTRKIIFGSLFFLVTIFPVIQLLPTSKTIAADRYTYIPLVGLFYIAGEWFSFFYSRKFRYNKVFKNLLLIIIIVTINLLSFLTFHRCQVWKDSITLWNDVLKKYPNLNFAYNNRGAAYFANKEYERAISNYTKAISIAPDYAEAYANRGNIYVFKEEYDLAIFDYSKAISIDPSFVKAYANRGAAYFHKKEYGRAISEYTKAISIAPDYAEAYANRGNIYVFKEEYDLAISDYSKAINIDPDFVKAYANRGSAYIHKKEYDLAIFDYSKAISIDPDYPSAYNWRGVAYADKGYYDKAISDYSRAIEIDPNYTKAYINRGNAYNNKKKYDLAISDYNKAIDIDSNYAEAYSKLAVAYFSKKDYDRSWENVRKAQSLGHQIDPEFFELLCKHSGRHE